MTDEIKVSVFRWGEKGTFYMQYRDPITKKKVRKSAKTKRRRDAERLAAKWEQKIKEGYDWNSGNLDWELFREKYRLEVLEGLADATLEKADQVLDQFETIIQPTKLRDVNTRTLSEFVKQRRQLGRAEATIKGDLAYLRAACQWAYDQRLIDQMPKLPKTKRANKSDKDTPMKGRPITQEEFERMLLSIGKVVTKPNRSKARDESGNPIPPEPDEKRIPSWFYLLKGLWLSGLRLGESMELHWTDRTKICVVLDEGRPKFSIPAESQKRNAYQLLAMAPDFAQLLLETPKAKRRGFVFNPLPLLAVHSKDPDYIAPRLDAKVVGKTISRIGEAAGVIVDWKKPRKNTPKKKRPKQGGLMPVYASAHDLRRSFGDRWSERVMPAVLRELMRHKDINTTMRYYVGQNADKTAEILWKQYGEPESTLPDVGACLGASPDTAGEPEEKEARKQ